VTCISCALAALALVARTSWASDHEDAPSLVSDPGVDIGDVFAFVAPEDANRLVVAMTVHPNADRTTRFDTGVEYVFHIGGDGVSEEIACRFQAPESDAQTVVCSANGFAAIGSFGATADASTDTLRVFAGLRADPAFADMTALESSIATGALKFTDAGTNTFAGKSILALVVSLDVDKVVLATRDAASGKRPVLSVSATTERIQ
jgi:hypothetical protein